MGPKDVEIIVQEDKVVMKLKKPTRSMSGPYQIKLSNAQGETIKEVPFNIQGIKLQIAIAIAKKSNRLTPESNRRTPLTKKIFRLNLLSRCPWLARRHFSSRYFPGFLRSQVEEAKGRWRYAHH